MVTMDRYSLIKRIGNEMLDLIYPPSLYCISCGKIIDDSRAYRLCNKCMESINWNTGRSCSKCGRPLAENDPGALCFSCAVREHDPESPAAVSSDGIRKHDQSRTSDQTQCFGHGHYFDRGYACAGYGASEQSMIFALKYGSHSDIGDTLGEMLYDFMTAQYSPDELAGMYDLVIPVPTHTEKKRKRGYNHAELMAQGFAKRAGLRHAPDVIVRTRSTLPMKGLGPAERMANIRGAFAIRESSLSLIDGARILLIDDIFTTGATIDEIARILKEPDADGSSQYIPYRPDTGGSDPETQDYRPRHAARVPGAARVDFLAFAAAGDMIV